MQTKLIEVDSIIIDEEFNSRDQIDFSSIVDLSKSIQSDGLIQPIVIRELEDGKHRLLAGFRRTKAHQVLMQSDDKFKMIMAVVRNDLTPMQERVLNLNENLARKDLNTLEEAKAIRPLLLQGMSEPEIVQHIPTASRGWVQIRVMLLKLPKPIQEEVGAGIVNQVQVRELYSMMHKGLDESLLYEEVKKIKDAKAKGGYYKIQKEPKKHKTSAETKHVRSRKEIFTMIKHLLSNDFEGLVTRALSWSAGEISDFEFFVDLADDNPQYQRPEKLDYEVAV